MNTLTPNQLFVIATLRNRGASFTASAYGL